MRGEPVVWIISAHQWPRAYLRAELLERGLDAVGYADLQSALAAWSTSPEHAPRVIVLDLRALVSSPEQVDVLIEIGAPVLALECATEPASTALAALRPAAVLRRPFTIGAAAEWVETIIRRARGDTPSNCLDV